MVIVGQLCEYTKLNCTLKMVSFMRCELYLNKSFTRKANTINYQYANSFENLDKMDISLEKCDY